MLPDAQAATLTRRFQQRVAAIGTRYAVTTTATFRRLGTYHDDDVARFAGQIGPATVAARRTAVALGVGYYAQLLQVRPPPVRYDEIDVPDQTRDPFIAMRTALKNDRPFDEALTAGVSRAEAIARNLAVSSARRTGDVVAERTGQRITGWRRVASANACEWCLSMTQHTYPTSAAADFGHDRDFCTPTPLFD